MENADMEPDSLVIHNDKSVEAEIVQAFENEEDEVPQTPSLMSASRASVDSQRSVSFFVDLNDEALMAQSAISRPISGRRTRSQMGDRLTQSMYVRSDSQSSGVSFFVDFSDKDSKKMVHSMSREEADHDLEGLSEDMRLKSSLLLAQNLEQTKAFFKKLKGYVDFLSLPSYSKDELRQKRKMAENISRLMFEEEQKLKKGQSLSSMAELDKILLGSHSGLLNRSRPKSAYCSITPATNETLQNAHDEAEKPILRRERTFDLDPKPNTASKIVEVNIDIEENGNQNDHNNVQQEAEDPDETSADGQTLQMFQQQRLYHTMRLKREIAKLERMEQDIAQKACEIGDMAIKNTQTSKGTNTSNRSTPNGIPSRPEGVPSRPNGVPKTTTFRDMNQGRHRLRLSMTSSESSSGQSTPRRPSTSSGLLMNHRTNSAPKSRGSQTNQSLFRNYYEKKDKAVYCRDRPQAFFIGKYCLLKGMSVKTEVFGGFVNFL